MAGNIAPEAAAAVRYTVLKLRLHPTPEQAALMEQTFGCCRYLGNRMLADAGEFYAATDLQYIPAPARYKKDAPFLRAVDSQALCAVHQDLRQAFLDFFRRPDHFRRPKFKRKKSGRDSFTTPCRRLPSGPTVYLTEEGVRLPKLGVVRAVFHRRPLRGWSLRSVTVTRTRSGKYFASLRPGFPGGPPPRRKIPWASRPCRTRRDWSGPGRNWPGRGKSSPAWSGAPGVMRPSCKSCGSSTSAPPTSGGTSSTRNPGG